MGVLGRDRQALEVENGLELGEQSDDEVLVRPPVGGAGVYLLKGKTAEQLQYNVVDIATKSKMSPRVC